MDFSVWWPYYNCVLFPCTLYICLFIGKFYFWQNVFLITLNNIISFDDKTFSPFSIYIYIYIYIYIQYRYIFYFILYNLYCISVLVINHWMWHQNRYSWQSTLIKCAIIYRVLQIILSTFYNKSHYQLYSL